MSAKRGNEETKRLDIGARSDALACRVALHLPRPDPDAARRRALLVKMGKGTAALAVLAPLSAHASGTHRLANSSLPGGFGYCTVSGYQSAAVSGAPTAVCSAFSPSYFLTTQSLTYSVLASPMNAEQLSKALNTKFGTTITGTQVRDTLLASTRKNLIVAGKDLVIYATSSNTAVSLQPLRPDNFPATINSLGAFNSIFVKSTDTSGKRTLLEVLYDGVLSTSPETAKCYFLSAYLTVYKSTSNFPAGFDTAYVKGQYTDDSAKFGTDAYLFFKALCGA